MTGILPVKKYGSHSALNMFTEYSMTNPLELAEYFGFTEKEVRSLCAAYNRSFQETQAWYDGYELITMDWPEVISSIEASRKLLHSLWNQDADICFLPRKLHADKPAVIIELKWDKTSQSAIEQIKTSQYSNGLKDYHGYLLTHWNHIR